MPNMIIEKMHPFVNGNGIDEGTFVEIVAKPGRVFEVRGTVRGEKRGVITALSLRDAIQYADQQNETLRDIFNLSRPEMA